MDNQLTIKRRLGKKVTKCVALLKCPDIFELENGDFAIIGIQSSSETQATLPADAGIGENEAMVIIPRELLVNAKREIPDS